MPQTKLPGTIIKSGLRIGTARKVHAPQWKIANPAITPAEVDTELATLQKALQIAGSDIQAHLDSFQGSKEEKEILNSHLLILQDPDLIATLRQSISSGMQSAARAVESSFALITRDFKSLANDFFAQRYADYKDVEQRLLAILTGQGADLLENWLPEQIAILSDVTPSQISDFTRHHVAAYCTDHGSYTSHASILTRSSNIIALTGLPDLYNHVEDGDAIILDAIEGCVILAPDQQTIQLYHDLQDKYLQQQADELSDHDLPIQTLQGRRIKLRCNLDLLTELDLPAALGADGIGLYRTEFLYLGKAELPSENLQYEIYREVAQRVAPHSVTIRSFDLGGDKLSHLIPAPVEENPYLGCRGIRFSLSQPEIFRTQIRAVLRASNYGRIKLMFPMVTDLKDFLIARDIVTQCRQELLSEGYQLPDCLPLGVMIEIPSAALSAGELAQHCDFFSIGTNDLVQYTLAADRNNSALAPYYTTHHPAVLQLLKLTLDAARKGNIPVSVCGEMASQPEYLPLLIGMGFSDLSVGTASFSHCKSIILRCDAELESLVGKSNYTGSLNEAEELIFNRLKPYYQH